MLLIPFEKTNPKMPREVVIVKYIAHYFTRRFCGNPHLTSLIIVIATLKEAQA
jgi:hypothetical protein